MSVIGNLPARCVHCSRFTGVVTMSREAFCWPPCVHYVAELRAALSDPETAEGAAMILALAKVKVGEG